MSEHSADYDAGACEALEPDPREPWVCMCGVHELSHVSPGTPIPPGRGGVDA